MKRCLNNYFYDRKEKTALLLSLNITDALKPAFEKMI